MGLTDTTFVVKDKEATDVGRFLNRILGLSVEKQNLVSIDSGLSFWTEKCYQAAEVLTEWNFMIHPNVCWHLQQKLKLNFFIQQN